MQGNPLHEQALKVISWMQLHNKDKESGRNILVALRSTFKTMDKLRPALNLLISQGYLSIKNQPESNGPGRKASPIYILRSDLCTQITQITHNTQISANSD